jgi:hypothetical protein
MNEGTHRLEVPRKRCPKDAREQFTALQRSHHEPALPVTAASPPYACRPMLAVYGVYDIRRLDLPFSQVLETGRREHQRPVNPGARHTGMVCNSGFPVNDEGVVRLGGIEPPTLRLEVLRSFAAFHPWSRQFSS